MLLVALAATSFIGPLRFAPQAYADLSEAQAMIDAGQYASAITLSTAQDTVSGYTLAAEALNTQVMLELVPNVNASAKEAKRLAKTALDLEPENREALIQFAIALGFETRSSSLMKAYFGKLPQKSKAAIDLAYAAAPSDARTSALLGAWHLGVTGKVEPERAFEMFGAREVDGISGYDQAVALQPQDIVIMGNYAVALLAIDAVKYRAKLDGLFARIELASPRNAVEREVKRRMIALMPLLDNPQALELAVKAQLNDPEP